MDLFAQTMVLVLQNSGRVLKYWRNAMLMSTWMSRKKRKGLSAHGERVAVLRVSGIVLLRLSSRQPTTGRRPRPRR